MADCNWALHRYEIVELVFKILGLNTIELSYLSRCTYFNERVGMGRNDINHQHISSEVRLDTA